MNRRHFLAAVALAVAGMVVAESRAEEIVISPYSYAAIAYSKSTGHYGYSYNFRSRAAAERSAIRNCGESDAAVVCWVNQGFCALALGDGKGAHGAGWSHGAGASNRNAMNYALTNCRERTTGSRIVICISSCGRYIDTAK